MSISSVSNLASSATVSSLHGTGAFQQQTQNLNQLSSALSTGSIAAANQAFNTVSANAPKGITQDPNSALSKVGKALQSGDIKAAQDALAALLPDQQHNKPTATQTATAVTPPAPSATVGTLINTMA